ncbi:MAG: hypothetical protein LBD45_07300 [Bacteroidales bacterium]|jgi:hypothetical protein|nr:hypothetical protein [Bacteroidales bacterium]
MKNEEALDTLKDIRQMMEKSTKCLSLSGLSGIFIGIYAIAGAYGIQQYLNDSGLRSVGLLEQYIFGIALAVLVLSILTAFALSEWRARKSGQSIFNKTARKMLTDLFIHLLPGGALSIAMGLSAHTEFITSVMLICYGLALISAAKFTFKNVLYLGYSLLTLGVINCFFTGYSLLLWTVGFGVLHIIYGVVMYFKYDSQTA